MNAPEPPDVEPLIRAYLRDQEQAVDAGAILAAVQAKGKGVQGRARPRPSATTRIARRVVVGGAAAGLILGFAWTFRQTSARAAAVRLVREARDALGASPPDRAYRVGITLAPGMAERAPYLAALAGFDCRLWARSDRFWIEGKRDGQIWACGRDDQRHVWVAPDRATGIDFPPTDLPEPLDEALDLFQFDLDSTLRLLATDFDVTTLGEGSTTPGVTQVRGTPRLDHPRPQLRAITVAIDERTKLVRQVVLSKARNGYQTAEVAFTLDGAEPQPDSAYQLPAHLDPGAPTWGHDQRLRRRRTLTRFFGSLLLKGE